MSDKRIFLVRFAAITKRPHFEIGRPYRPTIGHGNHFVQRNGEPYCGVEGTFPHSPKIESPSSKDVDCDECRRGAIEFERTASDDE
jgi:hypothetical protein